MLFSTENNLNAIKERKKKSFTKSVQEAVKKSENENIRGPSTCVECVKMRFPHMSNCAIRKNVAPENVWPRSRNLRSQEGRHNSRLFPPFDQAGK